MMIHEEIGVIHGRFQPFHIGHLEYVLAANEQCSFLYIGLANPDPSLTKAHPSNVDRAQERSNPFTYYERAAMVTGTLLHEGFNRSNFEIIPFPINYPDYIRYYVPLDATFFITIYDEWGQAKKDILQHELGVDVIVLEEGPYHMKKASGSIIRELMRTNGDWQQFVPNKVEEYIEKNNCLDRMTDND